MVLPINRSNRRQVLECGGNPAKAGATPLWEGLEQSNTPRIRKRRRRYALPAQSKTLPRQRKLFTPIFLESPWPVCFRTTTLNLNQNYHATAET
jgi:hypothetical protein